MKNKKKVEKLIKEQKLKKEKKTNKILFSIFIAFIFASIVFNSVYYFWCDIKCYYQETFLWDKEVPRNYVCMNGDKHKPHETKAISMPEKKAISNKAINIENNSIQRMKVGEKQEN